MDENQGNIPITIKAFEGQFSHLKDDGPVLQLWHSLRRKVCVNGSGEHEQLVIGQAVLDLIWKISNELENLLWSDWQLLLVLGQWL